MGCFSINVENTVKREEIKEIENFEINIYNIFEINENYNTDVQERFAKEIVDLENYVTEDLEKKGRKEQFFTTDYEDILDYIKDKDKTVMVCQDEKKNIIAASYITQGQGLYTYNDLSKYFKFNEEYIKYGKSKYNSKELCTIEYKTYMKKIEGYRYAKELIAKELNITDLVGHCKTEKEKGTFDETNKVREKVNIYIYNYFRDNVNDKIGFSELERFYLLKFSDLLKCEDKEIVAKCENETEENKKLYKEYDELLELFDLNNSILPDEKEKGLEYLKPKEIKKYFDANPFNTIELDTYMVHPNYTRKGLAKIVTFEGFKIQMGKLLRKHPELEEIYISATIHQDNNPSKRVTQYFGDDKFGILYVKRRKDINQDINREVYFYKICESSDEYIRKREEKIKDLYEYIERELKLKIELKKIDIN